MHAEFLCGALWEHNTTTKCECFAVVSSHFGVLGFDITESGGWVQTFRRNMPLLSSV